MKRIAPLLSFSMACALGFAPLAQAEPPIPTDPSGQAGGGLPGAYPLTVTGANVNASPGINSTIGGGGSDDLLVSFPSAGPIKWTDSRHNEGDIALLISPFDPNDPSYYPPTTHGVYNPLAGAQPFANTTLAWRVNQFRGALLASVRHNGVDNGDNYNGSPVGTIHGTAYFNNNFGQGWGFNANTGEFANGGSGSSDMQMGVAGNDDGLGEAVFNTSVAHFPYEQGWTGAWVNNNGGADGPGSFSGFSPNLTDPSTIVNWTNSMAMVTLPGVNSATDGMLFVAAADGDNANDIAAAFPTAGGWKVAVREDNDTDVTGNTVNFSVNEFQFLYVPYTAGGLVGGHINGNTGAAIKSAGDAKFDLTRTSEGQYSLSVYEADGVTKKNENAGMIIMSVAGTIPTDGTLPDRTMLSYKFDSGSGNFIIQSRELAGLVSPTPANPFGNDLALRDSDFYFTWVDFANPLTPTAPGDFDKDGDVDGTDLGLWKGAFGLTAVGDADSDGDSDGADFLVWQRNYAPGAAVGATAAVPEPAAAALAALGVAALLAVRKRQA